MVSADQFEPGKVYLIKGETMRDLINDIAKAAAKKAIDNLKGVENQISITPGADGSFQIGFANENRVWIIQAGVEVEVLMPFRPVPAAPT